MISKEEISKIYKEFLLKKKPEEIINFCLENKGKNYSIFNYMMAWKQAEQQDLKFQGCLKPFSEWKKEKIYLNSGCKSLKIFAPIFFKSYDEDKKEEKQILKGFMPVPVFDISQTNSTEFKKFQEKKNKIIYKRFEENFIKFEDLQNTFKDSVIIEIKQEENKINGCFIPSENKIIIRNNSINTLLHEIGHFLSYSEKFSYAKNEILAEITSFLILKKLNFEKEFNKNYANMWANNINEWKLGEFEKTILLLDEKINKIEWRF